ITRSFSVCKRHHRFIAPYIGKRRLAIPCKLKFTNALRQDISKMSFMIDWNDPSFFPPHIGDHDLALRLQMYVAFVFKPEFKICLGLIGECFKCSKFANGTFFDNIASNPDKEK